ncbi:MAG: dTDP-4-dehydrorhamnose reductase [Saprospiraceae bacterium]|nr:dTDP-4-dehydrorhamnose reductase [Candidatus Vicinibacter affinis]
MFTILVTGAHGQVASELKNLVKLSSDIKWIFFDRQEWDISSVQKTEEILSAHQPNILINTAAYTKVDLAEKEPDMCYKINTNSVQMMAIACRKRGIKFIHFSSDYVFHAETSDPIKEDSPLHPIGVYARSKAEAEALLTLADPEAIIIRSSWIYSYYGHNFVKTMLKLGKSNIEIRVVNDQIGSPTYAFDLANMLVVLVSRLREKGMDSVKGFFHYSNSGSLSWYDFACEIFEHCVMQVKVIPISTEIFNAPAPRPKYSVLDCEKIKTTLNIDIPNWKDSLHHCLNRLKIDQG